MIRKQPASQSPITHFEMKFTEGKIANSGSAFILTDLLP
jgi:hypothetical protein